MAGEKKSSTDKSTKRPESSKKSADKSKDSPGNNSNLIKLSLAPLIIVGILKGLSTFVWNDQVNVPFGPPLPTNIKPGKWGTLRPGVYFGTKSIIAPSKSLVTGLMWFKNEIVEQSVAIRHEANQNDRLKFYSWKKHDFDSFGIQEIVDNNLKLKTSILMSDNSWSAKVSAESTLPPVTNVSLLERKAPVYSIIYYTATDINSEVSMTPEPGLVSPFDSSKPFIIKGFGQTNYSLTIDVISGSANVLYKSFVASESSPPLAHLKEAVFSHLALKRDLIVLHDASPPNQVNVYAHQIIFRDSVEFLINYIQGSAEPMAVDEFDRRLSAKSMDFDDLFEHKFHLKEKGYSKKQIDIAQSMLSNMLGGIGYFTGSSKVARDSDPQNVKLYGPLELLTAVPSRSFFPRGFLWDEGFHNLLISRFDSKLGTSIIKSWFNLMNAEGWIPREVILGHEAEARVPAEFVVQRNSNGNPPTFFLALESLIKNNAIHDDELRALFPRLFKWYTWFTEAQAGKKEDTFRWRGRNASITRELNVKTLASGLDDYPRASSPTENEYHVDLRCWITLATRVMAHIAQRVGDSSADELKMKAARLADNQLLDQLHWSDEYLMYCDRGLHSSDVKLVKQDDHLVRRELKPAKFTCVPDYGYVSLFPFLMQIIDPSNPRLKTILDSLNLKSVLWSEYGLRSLSTQSHYYQQRNTPDDPPYWRGAIWLNINYLALRALNHYSNTPGLYTEDARLLYDHLRKAVVTNVLTQFEKSGYIWEQYDDKTGEGRGSHPFTGWSALTLLMMGELY